MTRVGRNEPCPCGSGKKYKRCCANAAPASVSASGGRDEIHDVDNALFAKMLRFAISVFGREWDPFEDFPCDINDADLDSPMMQLAGPWAVYENRFVVDNGTDDTTIAEMFREAHRTSLSAVERAWLEAQSHASISIWEVERVELGTGLHVHDLLTDERRFVAEVLASQEVTTRHAMLTRVVDTPSGGAVFCGVHPSSLAPRTAAEVVKIIRKELGAKRGPIPRGVLREIESSDVMISIWDETANLAANAPMPALHNTDGDPLLLTVDRFTFGADARDEVVRQLSTLEGADAYESEEDGELRIDFSRDGNAMNALPSTLIGTAVVGASALRLETNSVRRADALRARVEGACGELVRHTRRDHSDPEVLVERAKGKPREPLPAPPPEALAILREYKAKHYQQWVDTPLPALGGKTPREATSRKRDREKLDLLLKDMEHMESRMPEAERFNVSSLRVTLGL